MSEALGRHERDQERGTRMLTHRFLCPTSRLDALRRESFRPRRIGLIVDTEEIPPFDDLPVDFVEVRLNDDLSLDRTAANCARLLPPTCGCSSRCCPGSTSRTCPRGWS